MESIITSPSKLDQMFRKISERPVVDNKPVELSPYIVGHMRGKSPHMGDFDKTTDELIWVAGTTVGAELDEVWRETRSDWTHPIKDFYSAGSQRVNEPADPAMLIGSLVVVDQSDVTNSNLLAFVWLRNQEVVSFVPRIISPYADELRQDIEPKTLIEGRASLKELMDLPDPMIEDNFDICSVSAEESVARLFGAMSAKNPQFMALVEFELILDFGKRDLYETMGLKLPAYRLKATFHDLDFDQEQLDARAALVSNKLSQMVIRQFKNDGKPARYIVLSDLTPETVNIQHSATSCSVARRTASWLFMSLNERKEFPGEL